MKQGNALTSHSRHGGNPPGHVHSFAVHWETTQYLAPSHL